MSCAGSSQTLAANYVEGADGVGNDNIPTSASAGGVLQSFALFEQLDVDPDAFINKGLGQWAYAEYGSTLWSTLDDFVTGEVDMVGGSGSGMRLTVRFEAWPGAGGLPTNTRYRVVAVVDLQLRQFLVSQSVIFIKFKVM